MINVLCFVDGVNKPKKHTKCMAKVNTLLKNEGHNVHLGYISLTGLEALDKRGVNSMSEMVLSRGSVSSRILILSITTSS